ncbi:MAG: helix-turn-helix transcriptional regulator [Hungatella sp.]|nr:helix-turn-helix transcriptional regulator [Hungatella sp.]
MSTIIFIFDIVLIIIFACSGTLNVTAYCKHKHVRDLETGVLMFFYCLNSMIIFMSDFLLKVPLFEGAYHVLTYFGVKVICGIAISALYLCLTSSFLEKKIGFLHAIVMMPLICVTVYVGSLNGSATQHWIFYTIRQIYLAGYVLYYFIYYAYSRDSEYQIRISKYRPLFLVGGIFAFLVFVEDSTVIFNFQYVVNILDLKVFTEHNLSEDIFFAILAIIGVKNGFSQLTQSMEQAEATPCKTGPEKEVLLEKDVPVEEEPFITAYGLSNRQRDVLFLLMKDGTYQKMAEELGLSVGTVKFHAHGIYEKTDSRNRSELIHKYKEFYESRGQDPLT